MNSLPKSMSNWSDRTKTLIDSKKPRLPRPLSTELLKKIFLYTKVGCEESEKEYDWINITLVCRRWKDIALSFPDLWTFVSTAYGVKTIRTLLKLSKGQNLTALIRPAKKRQTTYSRDRAFELIKSIIGNVRELILIYDSKFKPMLTISPDSLSSINSLKVFMDSEGFFDQDGPQIPARLFEYHIQGLRNIWLNAPFDSWGSPLFTSLTSIELNQSPFQAVAKPSYEQLWNILERCPELEVLSLQGCLPQDRDERNVRQAAVRDPIWLPHLQHFRIQRASIQAASLFTSVLDIPRWTIRYFTLALFPPTILKEDPMFQGMSDGVLSMKGTGGTDLEIKHRVLKVDIYGKFHIDMQLTTTLWARDEEPTVKLTLTSFKGLKTNHMAHVLHLLDWDDVSELEVDVHSDFGSSDHFDKCDAGDEKACDEWCHWRAIFECLPNLKSLVVRIVGHKDNLGDVTIHYARSIIKALANKRYVFPNTKYPLDFLELSKDVRGRLVGLYDEEWTDISSSDLLCPELGELTIESDEISRLAPYNDDKRFWVLLCLFLQYRDDEGRRISRLALRRSKEEEDDEDSDIEVARELVDEVDVDF